VIENNTKPGILSEVRTVTSGSAYVNISTSNILNNGGGVYITSPNTTSVSNSSISGNIGYGLRSSSLSTLVINNNTFTANTIDGVSVSNAVSVTLSNNTFTNNTGYAVSVSLTNGALPALANNTGSGNGKNGIVLAGTLAQNATLPVNPSLPYILTSSGFTINTDVTLTLPAGIIFKGDGDSAKLVVNGTLLAQGTASDPIYFTSIKDDSVGGDTNNDGIASSPLKGDWRNVEVNSTGVINLSHTTLRYGGYYYTYQSTYINNGNLSLYNNAIATLDYVTSSDSASEGIYLMQNVGTAPVTSLTMTNSVIENNTKPGILSEVRTVTSGSAYVNISTSNILNNGGGVYLSGPNVTTITGSSIYSNTGYGVYNGYSTTPVIAKNNWWGSSSGPAPYGSGNGINYHKVYNSACKCYIITKYYVDVSPWLGQTYSYGQSVGWNAYVSDPVNTATGNYAYLGTDLSITTRSLPLAFSRSYNSVSPANGPLGYGWTFSYNVYITESTLDNSATITYGDGRTVRFTWDGSNYNPPAGTFSTLVKSGGLFTLTEKDQTIYGFNASRKLSTITDKNGNVTTLSYTGINLASVTAPDGRSLTFSYDGSNRITQVTDPLTRTLGFTYDANGDLVTFTDLRSKDTTYTYDANHRLLTITDANNHTFIDNTYDSDGRVIEQLDSESNLTTFIYDVEAHKTFVTDARLNTTTYEYDADLRLIKVTDPLGNFETYTWDAVNNKTSFTDKRNNTTTYTYDSNGNLLTVTDPLTHVTAYSYDANNNLLTQTDPLDRTTTFTYDGNSNLASKTNALTGVTNYSYYKDANRNGLVAIQTDPLSRVTTFDYNVQGDLTSITDPLAYTTTRTYDVGGRRLSETDPLSHTTTYTYDNANRVLTITDPEGGVTTNTYDAVGNLLTTTDSLGHTTTFTYTDKDKIATITDAEGYVTTYGYDTVGNQTSVTDGNNHTTTYTYDGANRLTGMTNPLGKTTTYTYDANGNRTGITDPLGHTTTYAYDFLNRRTSTTDALGHATVTVYDAVGNVLSLTDANNHATTYVYDDLNRLTSATDALSGVVTYTYDAVGNRLTMTDANNHTTTYTYDALNRLLTETDPLNHVWTDAYDAAGRRTSRVDAKGVTTTYSYDDVGRLIGISAPGISITYVYDLAGNRTSMVDGTGTTTYIYDDLNRPISIAQPNGTITYGYDAVNRTSVTLPGARTTSYVFDSADQLLSVTDWNSQLTTYVYDNAGRLITTTFPNDVVTTNAYDNADRLTGISTVKNAATILSITYTLDNVGNRLTMVEPGGTTTYTYDALNRLLTVSYPVGTPANVSYTYDAMGNRLTLTEDGVTTTYTYDAADRLTATTGGSAQTFTWDDNGQMLSKGSQTFSWDALGRMTGLVNGGTTASYAYNGDSVRVGKTVSGTTTSYLQDLGAGLPTVVAETTSGNTVQYVLGTDMIAQVSGTTPVYYHADGLGSTRVLTNSAGAATDQYTYDAFGASRNHSGSSANTFTFTGEQVDPEAGLVFLRARYLDPISGRFTSKDWFKTLDASSQSQNHFAYVGNNPISRIDPIGLSWQLFAGLEGGVMAGPVKIGGGTKSTLEFNGGIPDLYVSGSGGAKVGLGLDASLGPKVGVAYEFNGGVSVLPSWMQAKLGKVKLPLVEIGLTTSENSTKIEAALRTGVGIAFEPQAGLEAKFKSTNLKGKLGDWVSNSFIQPYYDIQYYQMQAEHYRRLTYIYHQRNEEQWNSQPSQAK
jgi:RHS repeat-associated protein